MDEVRLWRYRLPLAGSVSLRGGEGLDFREGVIVEALKDGVSYFGEAAPLPGFSRETLADSEEQLRHLIATAPDLDLSSASVFRGNLLPSVDFALWSIFASMREDPYSDEPPRNVPLCGLLNGEPDDMVAEAVRLSKAGYRTLKVKVGRLGASDDAETVRRVAAATGDGVRLRLDANRAWSMSEAMQFAARIEGVVPRIESLEEPLSDATPETLRTFSEEAGIPVALDETLANVEPGILDGGRYAFVRAVVLKPQVIGAARSLAFARRASLFGAEVVVSSAYESGVGMLGLLRFARECATETPPAAGLDTYRRLTEDTLETRLDLSEPFFDGRNSTPPKLRHDALTRVL